MPPASTWRAASVPDREANPVSPCSMWNIWSTPLRHSSAYSSGNPSNARITVGGSAAAKFST